MQKELKTEMVNLPIGSFYKDKTNVNEIGIKWMYVDDLIQFKTSSCLIHYDLTKKKEVNSLNNYKNVFDNPQQFVLTPFYIP